MCRWAGAGSAALVTLFDERCGSCQALKQRGIFPNLPGKRRVGSASQGPLRLPPTQVVPELCLYITDAFYLPSAYGMIILFYRSKRKKQMCMFSVWDITEAAG